MIKLPKMAEIEAIRAHRPLEPAGFVEFEAAAHEMFGSGAFDFHDKSLGTGQIMMLEPDELSGMYWNHAQSLNQLSASNLLAAARENMPKSYGLPNSVNTLGALGVRPLTTHTGERKRFLTAPLGYHPAMYNEKVALRQIIEEGASKRLPWHRAGSEQLRAKLAVIVTEDFIEEDELEVLAKELPKRPETGRGRIVPVTIDLHPDRVPA